jgi:1-hydroxycarotenoid 3,4-desaturase
MDRLSITDRQPVVIVGAGVAGLAAALDLAARGVPVQVLEAADRPGGKMRRAALGADAFDAGPTVLTMRWVFEELFADAGMNFAHHVASRPAGILARHAWPEGQTLDLHADMARSADAIARFAGPAEGRAYLRFCAEARATYRALEHDYIRAQRPSLPELTRRIGARRWSDLFAIRPFENLWHALGRHFRDPRLRQLFGRYATYCGSSPYAAPATLMLVAHVEQEGVWLPEPGMYGLAEALERAARMRGARFRYQSPVQRLERGRNGSWHVELAGGEVLAAGAVIANADAAAIARGRLGTDAVRAAAGSDARARSLSALTWLVRAPTQGFALLRHNVFFSRDYGAEFAALFGQRRLPEDPTIYVCAQDRGAAADEAGDDAAHQAPHEAAPGAAQQATGPGAAAGAATDAAAGIAARRAAQGTAQHAAERLLCLINAPADGDRPDAAAADRRAGRYDAARIFGLLGRYGLHIDRASASVLQTTPEDFERLYPGSGGALYGGATHGWRAAFQRPGAASAVPGLFLAGGSVHPGPGVPMAALSGRLAARCVIEAL